MDLIEFKRKFEHKKVIEEPNFVSPRPLVSVCVQTYQHANFIKECLDSILMQKTNFEFEILLGEDASTDGTREICLEYAENFPNKIRLYLHRRENNIGIGGSPTGRFILMTNLFSARGEYIALCEGDDYWTDPYKLQKQIDFLEANPEYVACFTNATILNETSNITKDFIKLKEEKTFKINEIIKKGGGFFPTPTLAFRNIIKEYPKFIFEVKSGDRALSLLLGDKGKFFFLNINSAVYRIHAQGIFSRNLFDKRKRNEINSNNIKLLKEFNSYTRSKYNGEIKDAISLLSKKILLNESWKNISRSNLLKSLKLKDMVSLLKTKAFK
ncbi:glycosyltransferase [Salegentibacter sediminis]|uniref:glycosyltransferase n=1 Tax=Salegentibacter sediminis TaxID=1930251 RepID=UPI0009BDDD60|nr:glycosyltransferase [Salegentibacter sediminis]